MVNPQHSFRKLRTRTLIQLGSIIDKSGVLNTLDIVIGTDPADQHDGSFLILLGALSDMNQTLKTDETKRELWRQDGERILYKERESLLLHDSAGPPSLSTSL